MKKILFITWERYNRRPELLAQHFNAKNIYIAYGQKGNLFQAPIKYLVQSWQSWNVLRRERPDVIFVQNPPILCALIVFFYTQVYEAQFIIDSHTGAFVSWKWRWSLGLHRLLSRMALITLVHNKSQEKIVKEWGCSYMVLAFPSGEYPPGEKITLPNGFKVAVIGSLLEDEPLDIVFDAASQLPDIQFYITGDDKRMEPRSLARKPANCHMTGFISYDKYVGLLREVDSIMTLTTRDHTLLMGGFEAISLEKPLLVSDWPILQDFFTQGAVFVSNDAQGICDGIYRAKREREKLQIEMTILNKQLTKNWKQQLLELKILIDGDNTNV